MENMSQMRTFASLANISWSVYETFIIPGMDTGPFLPMWDRQPVRGEGPRPCKKPLEVVCFLGVFPPSGGRMSVSSDKGQNFVFQAILVYLL